MGLAPVAVAPAHRRRGIGAVVVPGHPSYYPRFGIRAEFDAADEAFMPIELQPECLQGASGIVRHHAAFKEV